MNHAPLSLGWVGQSLSWRPPERSRIAADSKDLIYRETTSSLAKIHPQVDKDSVVFEASCLALGELIRYVQPVTQNRPASILAADSPLPPSSRPDSQDNWRSFSGSEDRR